METIKFDELKFKRPFLRDVMQMALENNLDVYVYISKNGWADDGILTYFLYNKDNLWGYCQLDWFSGMDLSCKYKPCAGYGSGRQIYSAVPQVSKEMLFRVLQECNIDYIEHNCKPYDMQRDSVLKYYKVEL